MQLSHILLSQRGAVGGGRSGFECSNVCKCHPFCSHRPVLLEVVDMALNAPESVELSRLLLSQRGAVGGGRSGLGCFKVCNYHAFCSPRKVLLEVVDLALNVPKCAAVTNFALPEGCYWR